MRSRLVSLLLPAAIVLTALTTFSQAAVQSRIVGAVSNGSRAALPGNVSGHAKRSTDLGLAPSDLKLQSMSLRFSMTSAQQADLTQLLAAQLTPGSPSYHQWLTSEQFGARFGVSSGDITKISAWLTSQGFTITSVAKSSTFINFSGTVAQAQQAFGTSIHNVSLNGEPHITNLSDPTLPSAISGVVLAVSGLDDFKLKARARARPATTDPHFTQGANHFVAPGDFYSIYDVTPALANNITGAGITVAVMGQTQIRTTDVAAFRTAAGLPANTPTLTLVPTSANPGISTNDIDESQIDVEWAGAGAPGATINFIYSTDVVNSSLFYAIDTSPNIAPIVTISYGGCEAGFSDSMLTSINQLLQLANSKGITVMSSSGDSGATDCDSSGIASEGLAVDFPSSSPFATSAGGTMFSEGSQSFWSSNTTTAIPNVGSVTTSYTGTSTGPGRIPEVPWDETTPSTGLDAGGAGGGGASGFFAKPAWQTGLNVPNDFSRDTPDVSLNAAALHDGYVVCSQGSCTNGFLATNGQANVFGGTSFVAPLLAGTLALVEQHLGTGGLGNIGPKLYGLAHDFPNVYHDIISGNNSVFCSQGTPNCPNGGAIGYNAATGYDQASGLGTLDVNMLVTNWAAANPTGTASTTGTAQSFTTLTTTSSLCAVSAATISLTATVTGSSGTPTGTVQFLVDNVAVGVPQALVSGAVTYTLSTSAISSGGHNISAVYTGDATFAGSKGSLFGADGNFASVDFVSATAKDFTLTTTPLCTASVSVNPGATSTGVVFTITPVNGFIGAVTMTAVNNNLGNFTPSFSVTPVNITSASGAVTTSFVLKASVTTAGLVKPRISPFQQPSGKTPWYAAGSAGTLACVLLLMAPRRRRWGTLLALLISVGALAAVGCGGNTSTTGGGTGGGGGGGTGGTTTNAQAGTYIFTVTAASGSVVHSALVTVVVP